MRRNWMIWAGGALVLAIGLALRLWAIASEPLWLDEAYSAYAADHGFAFLWSVVPRYETHPPFYYSLLRLWTLAFGNGLAALRALGVAAGIATLPVVALAARELGRLIGWDEGRTRRLSLAALALACVAIPLVEMTRQVRPYPLMILVYAGAIALLLRLARTRAIGGAAFVGYLLLVDAVLWLHNMGPLYAVALTLTLAIALLRRGLTVREWTWLVGGHIAVALAYLPGLLILIDQTPTWVKTTWLRFSLDSLGGHLPKLYAAPGWACLAALVLLVLAVASLWRGRVVAMLLVLAIVPLALSVLLSITVAPVFIPRTLAPAVVPALLLYAVGAVAWGGWWRWIGVAAAVFLGAGMLAIDVEAREEGNNQPWYPVLAWLAPRVQPGDTIFAYPNEGALPLAYALRDKGLAVPVRAIPRPVPAFDEAGGYYVTGSRGVVSLPRWRLRAIADAPATRAVPTIWLLRLGRESYDPGDVFLEELKRGRRVVGEYREGAADIVGLQRADVIVPRPARPE
jgi:uncharacterized membrane protein